MRRIQLRISQGYFESERAEAHLRWYTSELALHSLENIRNEYAEAQHP